MAKDKLSDYDGTTASNNTDIGGVSIAEGMLPSNVNNSMRELTKQLGAFADGTDGVDVLKLQDDTDTNSIKLQAPASVTATTTFTLPDGDGTADQVLKTDGSGQLDWVAQTAGAANPSLIINGAMTVAQRGADNLNITSAGGGTFAADRFKFFLNLGGTAQFDLQQVAEAPTGSGFANSLKVSCDATDTLTANNYLFLAQYIEGQNLQNLKKGTSSAESVTLSFWVKSNKATSGQVNLRDHSNDRIIGGTYTISSADTWQYVTMTFAGDTTGAITNNNALGMSLEWQLDSGTTYSTGAVPTSWETRDNADRNATNFGLVSSTSNYWQITGVKLEVGETATPFEHRSYGDELRRCQTYYYQPTSAHYPGDNSNGGASREVFYFPTTMRTAPTVTLASVSSGTIVTILSGKEHFSYEVSAQRPGVGITSPFKFDAEL